jgi:hypothetical protein
MAENTTVGPGGSTSGAHSAATPANHNTNARDGRTGDNSGRGADASSATLSKVGELKPVNP